MNASTVSPRPTISDDHTSWRVAVAWGAVLLTPVAFAFGFVLGYALGLDPSIADPLTGWDAAWRVVILWLVVVALSVAGMAMGWRAHRHGEPLARTAIAVNALVFVVLTLMTLVGGLVDAFGVSPTADHKAVTTVSARLARHAEAPRTSNTWNGTTRA